MALSQIQNIAVNGANGARPGLIAGLRQLSNTPEQRGKLILAVEGKHDSRLYNRFVNPERLTIHRCGGCRKIIKELSNLSSIQLSDVRSFLIVILDADGIRLPGVTPKQLPDMAFRTDTRDWETMAMRDIPLSDFWTVALGQPADALDVSRDLFDPLYVWSCTAAHCFIRQYRDGHNASANMSKFDWPRHTNLSLDETLTAIKAMPSNMKEGAVREDVDEALDRDKIQQLLDSYTGVNPWDLHRGHNLVKGLCHRYQKVSGRVKAEEDITNQLADNFPKNRFLSTTLAHDLESYLLTRGIADPWQS